MSVSGDGAHRHEGASDARAVGVVIGALALLGVVAGVLWAQLVTTPMVTRDRTGLITEGVELGRRVDADVWFALLGVVLALPAGVALMVVVARRGRPDPLVALFSLVAGALLAAVLCFVVGHLLGPSDPTPVLEAAEPGAQAPEMLTTHTWVVYLVWPLAATTGALVTLLLSGQRGQAVVRSDRVSPNSPS